MQISFSNLARALEIEPEDMLLLANRARLPFTRGANGVQYIHATDLPAWRSAANQIASN